MAGCLAPTATLHLLPLFCRHNRRTADCPICSQDTVLEAPSTARRAGGGRSRPRSSKASAIPSQFRGPYVATPIYPAEGGDYEVRLERVPGGLRLASWCAGTILRKAPVLTTGDLAALLAEAVERELLGDDGPRLLAALGENAPERDGVSPGRAGELRDELRVEPQEGGRIRIARWILRPNQGWQLQESPVMLPAGRYAEALAAAAASTAAASG